MATNNPYQTLVEGFARLLVDGEALSPAELIAPKRPSVAADAPRALIFAPHPDDEVIIGGLPLRLLRELKLNVVNVADLVAALSLHLGEVARNAYHLRMPAWMMDNVRRGAELVGGQGGAAPRFAFPTLYRLRRWANGRLHEVLEQG